MPSSTPARIGAPANDGIMPTRTVVSGGGAAGATAAAVGAAAAGTAGAGPEAAGAGLAPADEAGAPTAGAQASKTNAISPKHAAREGNLAICALHSCGPTCPD